MTIRPVIAHVIRLKYLSIQFFILLSNLYINRAKIPYLKPRLKIEANKKIKIGTIAAPAAIVKTLNGIGVNPAVKIVINVFDLNEFDSSKKTVSEKPGI